MKSRSLKKRTCRFEVEKKLFAKFQQFGLFSILPECAFAKLENRLSKEKRKVSSILL